MGNGTVDFDYAEVNGIVIVSGRLVWGSTTSISGNVSVSVPVTAASGQKLANGTIFRLTDASTGDRHIGGGRTSSTSAMYIYAYYAASTYTKLIDISDGTKPFASAWTTSDEIIMSSVYQAA